VSEPLKGIELALVAFLLVNLAAGAASLVLCRPFLAARDGRSARRRARTLLALCLLPGTASLLAVLAFFVPAYLIHEPAGSGETLGAPAVLLAAVSAAAIAWTLGRGLRTWRRTRRLAHAWAAVARPLTLAGAGLPAFEMPHPFPVVSVVGLRRPRLYVARQVLAALSNAELEAVLAHERAHVTSRDNLRHWLIAVCPDVLSGLAGRARLERAWLEAAEDAADETVARRGPAAALALAEALLAVARLVPAHSSAPLPVLALHNGDDLARRVRRLLGTVAPADEPQPARRVLAFLLLAAALIPCYTATLRVVHGLTEHLVMLLS
jgi:Zn-dependent protease with chaperone function